MNEIELINLFNQKGIFTKSKEFLVFKKYCNEYVDLISKENFAIIGIEGFNIDNNSKVQPNISEIADFSVLLQNNWEDFKKQSIKSALIFIDNMYNMGESNCYCFILYLKDEFESKNSKHKDM